MIERARIDDFLLRIKEPTIYTPDPAKDFGMYEKMDTAFEGLHEHLNWLQRNQGRIGYASQNLMSDLSKAAIEAARLGNEEELAFLDDDMARLAAGFKGVSELNGAIAEGGNRFGHTLWQEKMEADLFRSIWPVITGTKDTVPNIISWRDFGGNVQAYLYGFLDVVSELAKALSEELSSSDTTTEREFSLYDRYLAVAGSIVLCLSQERHVPGYVINNAYGHWAAYTSKLRTACGTIAHVRYDYNLRLSIQRMISLAFARVGR